jgi:hypothetical protein
MGQNEAEQNTNYQDYNGNNYEVRDLKASALVCKDCSYINYQTVPVWLYGGKENTARARKANGY